MFGEYGCLPMIAWNKTKTAQAFKLLARAREIDFTVANKVCDQLKSYELAKSRAIERNSDDPLYDVDRDIHVEDYIDADYIDIVNESKQYQNIIVGISPHACGHTTFHKDLRREVGIIRVKSETGKKDEKFCVAMDGVTADHLNYVKSDLLRVDVVGVINECFKMVGEKVPTVDELMEKIKDDKRVWKLFEDGATISLNQCESPATTDKVKRFKPKNHVELSAFVAAVRPGFASMVDTFCNRDVFTYGIPSLDKLLQLEGSTGNTAKSSFLLYDEQVLNILKSAGFTGPDAYSVLKSIKKKKRAKVLEAKEQFKAGFAKTLIEEEGQTEEGANDTVEKIWKIIEDSSSYLFNASHSAAVSADCLYEAYLKVNYPYEFYYTILKLYTEKSNIEKISAIVQEMRKFFGINLTVGKYGQDNTEWRIDKENHCISQSLSSIKYISASAARTLWKYKKQYNTFAELYHYLKSIGYLDTRQIKTLILMGYFEEYGKRDKLLAVQEEYENGKSKIYKTLKWETIQMRLNDLIEFEQNFEAVGLSPGKILSCEFAYMQFCTSKFPEINEPLYYVESVDDKYSIKIYAYNMKTGTRGYMRVRKDDFNDLGPIRPDSVIKIKSGERRPKYIFKNGKPKQSATEVEYWLKNFEIVEERIQETI